MFPIECINFVIVRLLIIFKCLQNMSTHVFSSVDKLPVLMFHCVSYNILHNDISKFRDVFIPKCLARVHKI